MKQTTLLFFLFLFLLSCLGQISSDLYLPALPTIREQLHTTTHIVQFSVALFMYGFAVSHLIYGPMSDSWGRKRPLIVGTVICIVGTMMCQFSMHTGMFLMGRLLQGLGAGASAALFRSIMRDVYEGDRLARMSSFLGISRVFLLASAPLLGSYILNFFGWRYCFTFLLLYAVICLIGACFLKETNKYTHLHRYHIKDIAHNAWRVLRHPVFMGYSICIMLAFAGILAWLTSLPILLQDVVGLTPVQFGWVAAVSGLFFAVGGFANAMLVERHGLNRMLKIGLLIMLLGGLIMLWFGIHGKITLTVIMLPVITYIFGSSMIFSNAYAGAFQPFPEIAGTAGAIFGFLQIIGGAFSSMMISFAHSTNQIPLAIALIFSSVLAFIVILLANRKAARIPVSQI